MTRGEHPQATDSGALAANRHLGTASRWHVEHVAETESTQLDLIARAENGTLVDRTVRRADFQSRGRGRLDRTWEAPSGANLLMSLGFADPPGEPSLVMRRVALAVVSAGRQLGIERIGLKWPNDVLIDGRKVAGLLAQRATNGAVVVGVGLNVGWAPPGATSLREALESTSKSTRPTATGSRDQTTTDVDENCDELADRLQVRSVLKRVLGAYDAYDAYNHAHNDAPGTGASGGAGVVDGAGVVGEGAQNLADSEVWERVAWDYRRSLLTIGQRVRVELPQRNVVGQAVGLDGADRLIVRLDNGSVEQFSVGDVVHLRPEHDSAG